MTAFNSIPIYRLDIISISICLNIDLSINSSRTAVVVTLNGFSKKRQYYARLI